MGFTVKINDKEMKYEKRVSLLTLLNELPEEDKKKYICAKVNNRVRELNYEVYYDCEVEFLTLNNHSAMKIYEASLRYVVAMAFRNCYPDLRIKFAYNVSRSISVHLLSTAYKADMAMYIKIKHEIDRIIAADYPLEREIVSTEEAAKIYESSGFYDKKAILNYRPEKTVHFYKCDDYRNYMYSHLVPSTGYITSYRFKLYSPGFLIQYPRSECVGDIPPFVDAPTYGRTLKESHDWAKIVGVDTVARINEEIETAGTVEFINICEDRHNRMLVELGQLIEDDIDRIRLICVAGPSSSGKTTFANRLRIELLSRGIRPIRISIDDYYKPSKEIPLGEDGERDLESIDALDVDFFQQNMLDLINGVETELPKFDFKVGHRVPGRKIKIDKDVPIIIEGIHALNDELSSAIPKSAKFKIFISPQAQINLDDHNPISLTDLRLIRRMVRDKKFRNAPAEETLSMWSKVRAGEFKWIYPYQEGCDYVFNSFMPYELPVLKKYAMPLLSSIEKESPYFPDAERLLRLLKFFVDMPDNWVPNNSLMREFIGGSCYADV
ncbi:MAG: nucleoside kinase [Bacilli bacterium]|nr:nucleoside kinase [Bacilli bacterium]